MLHKKSAILILLVVAFIGGVIYMIQTQNTDNTVFRAAFPTDKPASFYEPTNIHFDYEYIFLENVFSPLIEIDTKGTIQPGVAEKAEWIGDELHFTIRNNLKTQNGTPITADDVIFSLKRLLILSGNTHGNFKDLVCPTQELKSIEDDCPEIKKVSNKVILVAKERKSFLLPMLAAIDFAIIPRASVDPKTLKITDLKETSGVYYVASDDGKGHIELKLNPYHYHADKSIPQIVQLVPNNLTVSGDSLKKLRENKVDHVMTIDTAKADELLNFAKDHPEFETHMTMKIRNILLVFTKRGEKEFSNSERRYIGNNIRLAFKEIFKDVPGHEQRDEFFPSLGDGGLNEEQQAKIIELNKDEGEKPKKRIKLGLIRRGNLEPWIKPINKFLPEADCYAETNAPDFKTWAKDTDMPHAFIVGTDTGFMEDINLISYSLNAGLLGLSKKERTQWLSDYMGTEEKKARMAKLRTLHFEALAKPVVVPLMSSPYAALVRKPWKFHLSQLYANNQLWLIKLD